MYTVKFYLDTNAKTKKGHPIRIETYCDKAKKQRRRSSGHYQDGKRLRMTPELNTLLGELQDRVDYANRMNLGYDQAMDVIDNGYTKQKQIEQLEQLLAELKKEESKRLIDFINEIIIEREAENRSTRHFQELIGELEKWKGDMLDINDITYQKLKEYEAYKRQKSKTKGAIIHKTISTLKTVYNEAKKRGLVHNRNVDPFEGLKIIVEPNERSKVITREALTAFRDFQPKKGTTSKNKENMIRSRDLFLFQIYMGGHDMVEVANLKWSDIHEVDGVKRLRFQRFKLRSRNNKVVINNTILPEAQKIIDKYGTPDEERIFGWLKEPDTESYRQQNSYQRKTLERICKTMGIPNLVTKDPRSIFRSIGGQLGINEILLNQLMGHKPPSISHRYQQDLSAKAQDEAHRKIIDNLFNIKHPRFKLEEAPEGYLDSFNNPKNDTERNPDLIYLN